MKLTIHNRINDDIKIALKSGDKKTLAFLRVIIGEFDRVETRSDDGLSDDQSIPILKKLYKTANEQKNYLEINTLSNYLPRQLSDVELKNIIVSFIDANNLSTMKDIGRVMGELSKNHTGLYDGSVASKIIKEVLA